jgi:hypothetical protein
MRIVGALTGNALHTRDKPAIDTQPLDALVR